MERFAVIGLGRFGSRLAALLAKSGAEVIAVDSSKELVEDIRDQVARSVCLDATDEDALRSQGIDQVDVAVVGIGTAFEDAALATLVLKQLGVPTVISRATSEIRAQILSRIGADDIVNPEKESAERWRNRLLAPSLIERIELAEGYSLVQVAAPPSFHRHTLVELEIRRRYQVNVVAIRRTVEAPAEGDGIKKVQHMISVPMADTVIDPGDILLLIGSDEAMLHFPTR